MVRVTFIQPDGTAQEIATEGGWSLMEAAVRSGVEGIDADCGGACACATCHVSVHATWFDRVGPADDLEGSMLDFAPVRTPTSRLSCQIKLGQELDGLVVHIPDTQR